MRALVRRAVVPHNGVVRGGGILTPRRGLQTGWALATTGRLFVPVALLVLAYQRGGAGALAATSVALALIGAVMSAVVGRLGDRTHLAHVLVGVVGIAGGSLVLSTLAAVLDWPLLFSLGAGTLACGLLATFRPLQASLFPWLVHSPRELASANVAAAGIESAAALVGPLLAGAALLRTTPDRALAVGTACVLLALVPMSAIRLPEAYRHREAHSQVRGSFAAGLVAFFRMVPRGGLPALIMAQTFARGALNVLLVLLVIEVLQVGEDTVGWLWAAMGVGGLAGAALGTRLLRVTRLLRCFAGGVMLWGVGLVVLAAGSGPVTAGLGMFVIGVANAIEDPGVFTSAARLAPPGLAAQAMGAVEIVVCVGMALGSAAAPGLASVLDVRPAILCIGAGVVLIALLYWRTLRRLDHEAVVSAASTELLTEVEIFEPLPLVVVEHLATRLTRHDYAMGEVVITEGEPGDSLHVIVSGAATVTVDGTPRPDLAQRDTFGEIALLRDIPRTATVTADGGLTTLSLQREDFLTAIQGNCVPAETLASARLRRDDAGEGSATERV